MDISVCIYVLPLLPTYRYLCDLELTEVNRERIIDAVAGEETSFSKWLQEKKMKIIRTKYIII